MMPAKVPKFEPGDIFLVVDTQIDFCPGGALAIEEGDQILGELNLWIRAAKDDGVPVYASRDWHPKTHVSFSDYGGDWPAHCIQDTDGARFHPALELPYDAVIVTKGVRFDRDQNSVFDETGLADWLHRQGVKRIFVGGLAQDVCVLASILDGCEAGFKMHLILGATRPVSQEGGKKALESMRAAGAEIMEIGRLS